MRDPNAIVSTVVRFDPPLDVPAAEILGAQREITVELEGERRARLDPADPRAAGLAQVLAGLRDLHHPVYLEVEPETSTIRRLLIPTVGRVVDVRARDDGGLAVELEPSHALRVLPRDDPDFEELERQLRGALRAGAPVLLVDDDARVILDVRPYLPVPEGPPFPLPDRRLPPRLRPTWAWKELLFAAWRWRRWPWWWLRCVSPPRAQQVFDAMSATSCDPLTVPAPCIPFLYPDDGCWARAHEMSRLMLGMGHLPRKVWIRGTLRVDTRNNPNCLVSWGWHVAPTLCVRHGLLRRRRMVIDPSLFTTPVSQATWKSAQGDASATLTDTDASVYHLFSVYGAVTDPTYSQTNYYLAQYRLHLQNRAVHHGAPPYTHCP